MGVLKDISGVLKDARGIIKELQVHSDNLKGSSIAKMSTATTLQFPVIVSSSINIDTATSVTKALERQYAIFVQMVISLNPYLDLQQDTLPSYLNKIHQNNPTPLDLLESCTNVYSDEAYGVYLLTSINNGSNGNIERSNKEQMFTIEECLNMNTINDLYKPENITYSVAESSLDYFCKSNNIILERNHMDDIYDYLDDDDNQTNNKLNTKNNELEKEKRQVKHQIDREKRNEQYKINAEMRKAKREKEKEERDRDFQLGRELRQDQRDQAMQKAKFDMDMKKAEIEARSKALVKFSDSDVKKANELVPTTLAISMHIKDGNSFGGINNFVIGVKGLMHPVTSPDIVSNLLDGYKSGNAFFNFIRWTTGEITFLKDLLFNVDGIKEDVVRKYSGNSHWWTTLKRRRTLAKMKNTTSKNKLLPNASIVCSMEEVAEMKDAYNVDLMDPKNIKRLMDRYFLLGFVIVDESQELCYIMFDGENNYQAISFKGLEKENNSKNDFKDIYKMINSGRL